jgi:hypothetical protein
MLYMSQNRSKIRVTFRVDAQLAAALRQLPNQTLFVETALAAAFGETCPLCDGRGRVPNRRLRISDFKAGSLPRLSRHAALRLREVVRLGYRLLATDLELRPAAQRRGELTFELLRSDEPLLTGRISDRAVADIAFPN